MENVTEKIKDVAELHRDGTRFKTALAQRVVGFVLHVDPIAIGDGSYQFTRDWALIELYEEAIDWKSVKGNKVSRCSAGELQRLDGCRFLRYSIMILA